MNDHKSSLDLFLRVVQSRLNRYRFRRTGLICLAICALIVVLVGAGYVLAGYSVPRSVYYYGAGGFLVATILISIFRRYSTDDSARFSDQFFGLKDSLASALHFRDQERKGEFVELQVASVSETVKDLDPKKIPFEWSRRVLATAGILVLAAGLLGFKQPSTEVMERLRVEAETEAKTEEINSHLREVMDELEESLDEEEKEELNTAPVRKAIAEMEETRDRKEAMRQYAGLERQLRESARRLDQRKNEQLMARAGAELQKDPENRALGKKMAEKKFREAASELQEMQKANESPPKEMSAQQKELARLKSATQRMAAAAKASSRQGATSSSGSQKNGSESNNSNSESASKSGKSGQQQSGAGGSSGSGGDSMEDTLEQLNQSVANLSKSLEKAAGEQRKEGSVSKKTQGECKSCRSSVSEQLKKLSESLCKMGAKCESRNKLLSMCKSLGQCQGYLNDSNCQSLSQCLGSKPGSKNGKGIGSGSSDSTREPDGELVFGADGISVLQGAKGEGPSSTMVESAESGDGVSSRRTTNQRREFKKQMESFVQREDVPDDVKEGVKEYFTRIHGTTEE